MVTLDRQNRPGSEVPGPPPVPTLKPGCSRRFAEATSKDLLSFADADCARIAGAFTIPTPTGTVTASAPATERTTRFAGLSLTPTQLRMIAPTRPFRFAPAML